MAVYVDPNFATSYASLSAAVTAIGTASATIFVKEATTVTADLTIPTNIAIRCHDGGTISVDSGKTLTINGPFAADLYKVFTGSGTIVFGSRGWVEAVYPNWWGAVTSERPSPVYSDVAINAALASVAFSGGSVDRGNAPVILSPGTFQINGTLTIPGVSRFGGVVEGPRGLNPTSLVQR